MIRQGDRTAATVHDFSAVPALDYGGAAPAIQEQDRLLSLADAFPETLRQASAEYAAITVPQFLAHILNLNPRQFRRAARRLLADAVG
jgi:hypothetical protein